MRAPRFCLAASLAVSPACERALDIELQWLTWLSYREIEAVAAMPDGGLAIAGRSLSDEGRARIGLGQSTFRPFAARLDADGTAVWTDLGFLGETHAIAAAEDGAVYVVTSAHEDLDGLGCDLVAHAPDGTLRWKRPIAADGSCPWRIVAFDDRLVIGWPHAIDVLDRDGATISRIEAKAGEHLERLATSASDLWVLGTRGWIDAQQGFAWHFSAGARKPETIDFEQSEGWASVLAAAVREDGIDVIQIHRDLADPYFPWQEDVRFAAYRDDGRMIRAVDLPGSIGSVTAIAPGKSGDRWLVGTSSVETPSSGDLQVRSSSGRIWLRRVDAGGDLGPEATRWFADPAGAAPERVECVLSDVDHGEVHGTRATFAVGRADGTLVIAGEQHCRDAWVAAFEVR